VGSAYLLCVWAHIVAAAVWIGSMAFFALAVVPVLRRPEHRDVMAPLVRAIGRRFRVVGWACLVLLVATGAGNLALRGLGPAALAQAAFWGSGFGRMLAYKLGLVGLVLGTTAVHDAFSSSPRRALASWLGRASLLLSVAAALAGVMLVRGAPW
jgi:putative copper resistance protein D